MRSNQKYRENESEEDIEDDGSLRLQRNQEKLKKMLDIFDEEVEAKQRFLKKPEKAHKYHTV